MSVNVDVNVNVIIVNNINVNVIDVNVIDVNDIVVNVIDVFFITTDPPSHLACCKWSEGRGQLVDSISKQHQGFVNSVL